MENNKWYKKYLNQRGITLIALIITIIVMLILVTVSIQIALNTGLFESAGKATKGWQTAQEQEQQVTGGQLTIGNHTYAHIDDYINGLKEKTWTTVFEGEVTSSDGEIIISTPYLLDENTYYKFTIESDEYTGTIESKAVRCELDEGVEVYALFIVEDGKITTFDSETDLQNKVNSMESGTVLLGVDEMTTGTVLIFQGATCEYKITKIEKECKGTKIFEGELEIKYGEEVPVNIDLSKKYEAILEYNEQTIYAGSVTGLGLTGATKYFFSLTLDKFFSIENNIIKSAHEGLFIKEIYEIEGNVDNYKKENNFAVLYISDEVWALVETPDTSYLIPQYVAGEKVETVMADCISGTPIFDRAIELGVCDMGEWLKIDAIKVTTPNYEFIFENEYCGHDAELDLSECGDNIQIPSRYLEDENDFSVIYVSPAAKLNYQEYDKIVAK